MNKWLVLFTGLVVLIVLGILAYTIDLVPTGQLIAVIASAAVATVGFWIFFRSSNQRK